MKQLRGKFRQLEIGLKISAKKNMGKVESGENKVRVRKKNV